MKPGTASTQREKAPLAAPWPARTIPQQLYFVLEETPCPYLAGKQERKLVTRITGRNSAQLYSLLSRAGFRRSHGIAYRPACSGCSACVPVRVAVEPFDMSRSLARVARANADLHTEETPAVASTEQFALFNRYIGSRHGDGEMAEMTFADYKNMIELVPLDTRMTEFRNSDGTLVAACLVDWLDDGPSAVYSFFEPELQSPSLGTFMVLWLIDMARQRGLPYVYLGYWIADSRKMAYKARFRPLEALTPHGWQQLPL